MSHLTVEAVLISHSSERGALINFRNRHLSLSLAFAHRYFYALNSLSIFNRSLPKHLSPRIRMSVRLSVSLSVFYSLYEYFCVILHHSWCIFRSFHIIRDAFFAHFASSFSLHCLHCLFTFLATARESPEKDLRQWRFLGQFMQCSKELVLSMKNEKQIIRWENFV